MKCSARPHSMFWYMEAARFAGGMGALVVQSEIQGTIKVWAEDHQVDYQGFSSTEVKKHFTGKGNAKKDQMIAEAKRRWPTVDIGSDDQADALAVLSLAQSRLQ